MRATFSYFHVLWAKQIQNLTSVQFCLLSKCEKTFYFSFKVHFCGSKETIKGQKIFGFQSKEWLSGSPLESPCLDILEEIRSQDFAISRWIHLIYGMIAHSNCCRYSCFRPMILVSKPGLNNKRKC